MAICVHPKCGISAHSHIPDRDKWIIFKIPEFHGLTCFQIAHHELSNGLFSSLMNNLCNKNIPNFTQTPQQRK